MKMNEGFHQATCNFSVACDRSGCEIIIQSYVLYNLNHEVQNWQMEDALNKIRRELKNLNDKWAIVEAALTPKE